MHVPTKIDIVIFLSFSWTCNIFCTPKPVSLVGLIGILTSFGSVSLWAFTLNLAIIFLLDLFRLPAFNLGFM